MSEKVTETKETEYKVAPGKNGGPSRIMLRKYNVSVAEFHSGCEPSAVAIANILDGRLANNERELLGDALKALEASNNAFSSTLMALKMKMGESDPKKLESFVENHWAVKQARGVLARAKK